MFRRRSGKIWIKRIAVAAERICNKCICEMKNLLLILFFSIAINTFAQHGKKFEPLGTLLPTPNEYRTASGAPGPNYWQQRADYDIRCELKEGSEPAITGSET